MEKMNNMDMNSLLCPHCGHGHNDINRILEHMYDNRRVQCESCGGMFKCWAESVYCSEKI